MMKSRVRAGFHGIRLPGQRVMQNLRESDHIGVPMAEGLLETLNALAEQQGIAVIPAE